MSDDLLAGRYQRLRPLGAGGMGDVWLAEDLELGRHVAVKRLRVGPGGVDPDLVNRMLREARVVARLNHPGIVTLHDLVREDGVPFLIMEFVDGESLADRVARERTLPWVEVAAPIADIAAALALAHQAGVLHRDVKPANVLLDRSGRALLADFGIARGVDDVAITKQGELVGTVAYMPPEVARGQAASSASDVWSLGATLFAATEGAAPFADSGASIPQLIARLIHDDAPPPRRAGPLTALVVRMLHTDPTRRPGAGVVAAEIRALLAEHGSSETVVSAPPTTESPAAPPPPPYTPPPATPVPADPPTALDPPTPAPTARRRSRTPLVVALVLTLLVAGGIAGVLLLQDDAAEPPAAEDGGPTVTSPGPTWQTPLGLDPRRPEPTPDGALVLVSNRAGNTVSVISTDDGSLVKEVPTCDAPLAPAVTLDSTTAFVPCSGVSALMRLDLTDDDVPTAEIALPARPSASPTLSPDGEVLHVPMRDGFIAFLSVSTEEEMYPPLAIGSEPGPVTMAPDDTFAFVTDPGSGSVFRYRIDDPADDPVEIPAQSTPFDLALNSDGTRVFAADPDGFLAAIELDGAGDFPVQLATFSGELGRVRVDPRGHVWAPLKSSGLIAVLDPANLERTIGRIQGGTSGAPAEFGPDTGYAPDGAGGVLAIDLDTLEATPIEVPDSSASFAVLSPDGDILYVVDRADGTAPGLLTALALE